MSKGGLKKNSLRIEHTCTKTPSALERDFKKRTYSFLLMISNPHKMTGPGINRLGLLASRREAWLRRKSWEIENCLKIARLRIITFIVEEIKGM